MKGEHIKQNNDNQLISVASDMDDFFLRSVYPLNPDTSYKDIFFLISINFCYLLLGYYNNLYVSRLDSATLIVTLMIFSFSGCYLLTRYPYLLTKKRSVKDSLKISIKVFLVYVSPCFIFGYALKPFVTSNPTVGWVIFAYFLIYIFGSLFFWIRANKQEKSLV